VGVERLVLAGRSGAGPYLLACGAGLGARITRLGLVACIAPFEPSDGMSLARRAAFAVIRLAPSLARRALPKNPEALYRSLTRDAPPSDRAVLTRIWMR